MSNTTTQILWISPEITLVQDYILSLEQCGFSVTHSIAPDFNISSFSKYHPTMVIVSHQKHAKSGVTICLKVQSKNTKHDIYSLLITEKITLEEKENYFKSGGNELILTPFCQDELLIKVRLFFKQEHDQNTHTTQLAEASQMAILAMDSSSDLGCILNFVKGAIASTNYAELASHMFDAASSFSDSSMVEIKGHHAFKYLCSKKIIDPDMKQFMQSHKSDLRVIQIKDITQINQDHLVFLVEGLPVNDTEKMGRISDTLVMLCDIADRFVQSLSIEENIQKSEEVQRRFLSTLSHELRTPLNSILGFSKVLVGKKSDKPIGDSGLDALKRIIDNTDQVNIIINTLLEISSSNTQDALSHSNDINIDRLLLRVRSNFKKLADDKGLHFNFTAIEGLLLNSDEKKVITMLNHLLDNAIKFTDEGQISLTVGLVDDTSFGNQIYFDVSDTGIGIEEINHHRIFSEIGQLNTEHDRRHYGIGLGLYYVDQISQQLGGKISLKSELNKGSTFRLSLPINLNEASLEDDDDGVTLF